MPVRRTNRRGQGKSFPTPAVPAELTITSDEHYYNLNALLLEIIPIGSDLIPPSGYYGQGLQPDPDYQFPNDAGEDTVQFYFDLAGGMGQARLVIEFTNGPLTAGDRILFTPFNRALRGARGEFMAATLYEIVTP